MKKAQPKGKNAAMQERYPRTISQEVFDAWQILRRKKDAEKLCAKTGLCRPIVDRALNYGHVNNDRLQAQITLFFNSRFERENENGQKLLDAIKS